MSTLPIISLVGPTAVGKSAVAIAVAENILQAGLVQQVDIISADSRQVYQGLEILSGADVPLESPPVQHPDLEYPFWEVPVGSGRVRWHGQSIISPHQEWSVAHFQKLAHNVYAMAPAEGLVMVVGGTGLYHDHLGTTDAQLRVPPNMDLRSELSQLSLEELQIKLQHLSPNRWAGMTYADQQNPRRLIRAIEICAAAATTRVTGTQLPPAPSAETVATVTLGITDDITTIAERISERVKQRFNEGAVNEVTQLYAQYDDLSLPAFSATGVKEIRAYVEGMVDQTQCLELWTRRELQYAKRQLTWWKKHPAITWFLATQPDMQEQVCKRVKAVILKP